MEQRLDDSLAKEDRYAQEDAKPRPYEWRTANCIWCKHPTRQQYFPNRDKWQCEECGQPNWTDGRAWEENAAMSGIGEIEAKDIWGK